MKAVLTLLSYLVEQILISLPYYALQLGLVLHFRLFLEYLGSPFELSVLNGLQYFIEPVL